MFGICVSNSKQVKRKDKGTDKKITFILVLALISPPLQLLAVIIEALQAHDAIMQAHPVGSKSHKGHGAI